MVCSKIKSIPADATNHSSNNQGVHVRAAPLTADPISNRVMPAMNNTLASKEPYNLPLYYTLVSKESRLATGSREIRIQMHTYHRRPVPTLPRSKE